MFHLRKKREVKPLSLPVLLSFNELAWIAAGAFALVCVFFWWAHEEKQKGNAVLVARDEYATLTNRAEVSRQEFQNYARVGTTGRVVTADAHVLEPGRVSLTEGELRLLSERPAINRQEYEALRRRPAISQEEFQQYAFVGATGKVVDARAQVLSAGERSMSAERYAFFMSPERTNVLVSEWERLRGAGQYRAELLNLKGGLTNVVILLDASASMKEKGRLQVERWKEAQEVIRTWLTLLPIQRCALVIFSDASQVHTTNAAGHPIFWEMNEQNRDTLVQAINEREPAGNTGTWSALINAYNHFPEADTILLFTDGKPFVPKTSEGGVRDGIGGSAASAISREQIKLVLELVQEHRDVPVNVVGLGDYFEKEQAEFLLEICRRTGGSFLGR